MTTFKPVAAELANALRTLLADVHLLSLRARFYHWNVTGIWFKPLHELFETHYDGLSDSADVLAERLRALQMNAPHTLAALIAGARLNDDAQLPDAQEMVRKMLEGYTQLNAFADEVKAIADRCDDAVTGDMMVELMTEWQKTMWMLRAHLA